MRRVVVSVLVSVDGRYRGPGGDLSVLPFHDAFNTHNLEVLERAGTIVYGSRWFLDNQTAWRAVAADPNANDRDHRIAEIVTRTDSLIVSDSFEIDPDAPWAARTTVIGRADAPAELRRRKAEAEGGDLVMFGSATTWNPLVAEGLVDELVVLVGPGLAGAGDALYTGNPTGLELLDATVLDDSPLVRLRYRIAKG